MLAVLGRARIALAASALSFALTSLAPRVSMAAPRRAPPVAGSGTIGGVVDDARTGLPLAGATVELAPTSLRTTSARDGTFEFSGVAAGSYILHLERLAYQPADSVAVDVASGARMRVTIALDAVSQAASEALRTIGRTSIRATESLQRSSTIYRSVQPESLVASGTFRFGDALRTLPGINNAIPGDTAALGDDLQLNVRGIGTAETTATLDGHPIGYGVPGGYNYQLSPSFGLRDVTVYYGSAGTDLIGYDAIGGIVDSETIEPTKEPRENFTQGAGTFGRLGTSLTATGPLGNKFGYALAYGVSTLDGPFNNDYFSQPGAAYDPSATDPAVRALAIYKDDSTATTRSGLAKLRYNFSDATHLTLTSVNSSYWEDKTGNGDGDYLAPAVALARGRAALGAKGPKDTCPAGEFTAVNPANGVTFGTGPNGLPDGGHPCQTPQSYAALTAGLQGAGPAWQSFNFNDQALHLESASPQRAFRFDAFTDRYFNTNDRTFSLPFVSVPGDSASYSNTEAVANGLQASESLIGRNNEFALGLQYTNYAYKLQRNGSLRGAPIVHETGMFAREAYHVANSPLALYGAAYAKHDTTTNASYVDPRLSVVYTFPGARDVLRVAAGATTTEPLANELDQKFTPANLVAAGGGGGLSCGRTNAVGSAPSSVLRPERGVDEELAYGHRFGGDSQVQLALYNTNVFDKIYATITPLSITGTSFIDPATLARAHALVAAQCPGAALLSLLGVSGNVNIGQLRARGFTLSGRQRIDARTFLDYDWDTTSTVISSVTPQFLQQNPTDIVGTQLPRLPLHTFTIAADALVAPKLDVRYTLHAVSDNNTKRLPGYNYSDLLLSTQAFGHGTFTVSVFNLWQQNAFIEGYLGLGQPLALNSYATPGADAPYLGAGATELFGLPYRSVYFSYALQLR